MIKKITTLLCVFAISTSVFATRFYVKTTGLATNNGLSWATAYNSLNDALINSIAGDEIWVASGTYKPSPTVRATSFTIPSGVKVYGGFIGTETTVTQRDWNAYPTTLSGDIGAIGSVTDNSYHIVYFNGGGADTRLDGFRVTGGNANNSTSSGNNSYQSGGGVFIESGNPTITHCKIVNNASTFMGYRVGN